MAAEAYPTGKNSELSRKMENLQALAAAFLAAREATSEAMRTSYALTLVKIQDEEVMRQEITIAQREVIQDLTDNYTMALIEPEAAIEAWGSATAKNPSKLSALLSRVALGVPILNIDKDVHIRHSDGVIDFSMTSESLNASTTDEKSNDTVPIREYTAVGEDAIVAQYKRQVAHIKVEPLLYSSERSVLLNQLQVANRLGWEMKKAAIPLADEQTKTLRAQSIAMLSLYPEEIPHMGPILLHDALIHRDTKLADMVLNNTSPSIMRLLLRGNLLEGNGLCELGVCLDVARSGEDSVFVKSDSFSFEETLIQKVTAIQLALDRRKELLANLSETTSAE